jgi:hypothetical protein
MNSQASLYISGIVCTVAVRLKGGYKRAPQKYFIRLGQRIWKQETAAKACWPDTPGLGSCPKWSS